MLRNLARKYIITPNTFRYRVEVRNLSNLISTLPGGKLGSCVVDAGAGSGEISMRLHKMGHMDSLIGIEPSGLYKLLKQNYAKSKFETYQAGLEKLPLIDSSVDALISTQVFEHIDDDETAANEVARVVKPGGYALITTPHPPEIYPNPGHVRPGYTLEQMRELFEPKGFQFVDVRYYITLKTLRRLTAVYELGKLGKLLPMSWADREINMSQEEIKADQPYGIACVFKRI